MIDVIIPAYNAHSTIRNALDSLCGQLKVKSLNVLIVDDYSNETYDSIVDEYKDRINLSCIRLEKNSGPGFARQVGIENTKSEYIMFLDADDFLADMYSIKYLYDGIQKNDFCVGKMLSKKLGTSCVHMGCLHGKMYRRSIIEKNKIHFLPVRSHEDNVFNRLYSAMCKSINVLDKLIYIYNDTEGSLVNTEDTRKMIENFINAFSWLADEIDKREVVNKHQYAEDLYISICYLYGLYVHNYEVVDFILRDSHRMKESFLKFEKYLTDDEKKINYILLDTDLNDPRFIRIEEFIASIK